MSPIPIQFRVVQRVVGVLLALFSLTMLTPFLIGLAYRDPLNALTPFFGGFLSTLAVGLILWLPVRTHEAELRIRDGFLIVVLFWAVLGIFGGLPFYLYGPLDMGVARAIFESMSGLTTTGATVIIGLDLLPKSILFYRQQMQWLGGMGIIVLAVAILPLLGIGGQQLYKAETPGINKGKLTPRIANTAKALWYIYLSLTIACAMAYFSTHDSSIGYFDSTAIEMIAVVFMLISGVNFALHFTAARNISLSHYWRDEEFRTYLYIALCLTIITSTYLYVTHTSELGKSLRDGLFHVVSIGTTTGFTSEEYFNWPGFLPVLLLFASFAGGCAGSTGGGMKVVRVLLLFKQGQRELHRMLHPYATVVVKVGRTTMPSHVIDVVWGFFASYLAVLSVMLLMLMAAGLDQESAFSAVVACLNNLGPGLGIVAANYSSLGDFELSVLSVAMLFGRLEIFTLLVLFTPAFWRY